MQCQFSGYRSHHHSFINILFKALKPTLLLLKHKTTFHFVIFYYLIEPGTFLLAMEVTHLYAFRFYLLGSAEKIHTGHHVFNTILHSKSLL